jgi:sugar/nucleoside kinase (ribokinase family)
LLKVSESLNDWNITPMPVLEFDCVCAGIIVADHVCDPVERVPGPGELVLTRRIELTIGGCASNVAVDLAKLGCRTAIAGTVGRDIFGRFCRETLEHAGVDCRHLAESPHSETSGTLIINTRGEDRRFIHAIGANHDFSGREITLDLIRSCRVLYLGGYCLSDTLAAENVALAFQQARSAGVTTVLDVVIPPAEDHWAKLRPVLPWTDVFLPNADEARLITGSADPFEQAEQFRSAGARTAVITCGGAGAVLVNAGQRLRAAAYPVEFVDGTGSGDAFVAGYIYGLLNGGDAHACLRSGSALGASCVRTTGATTGVFSAAELETFIAQYPLAMIE